MFSLMDSRTKDRARSIFTSGQVGLIPPHELPDVATELLVMGYDSPTLRELAGLPPGDRSDAAELWEAAREELGFRPETDEEAARFLLRHWAQEIAEGRLEVVPGSRRMLRVGWFPLDQPEELVPLLNLLDDWDEIPRFRERIASELLVFAQDYVHERPRPSS
ncbi:MULTISPECIES: hypothetical protein [Arthrobacter]|uniref:Uncharacterized protein n=2 Tax=Arthrobacter TaxID=1663 RepID=A0ABU9KPP4_9MICC|nr:hypothetical protein [Arthrobacter sp. YJM1]MDP5228204.1 hypothetical protein [Arthrobacter sp. YJM1]